MPSQAVWDDMRVNDGGPEIVYTTRCMEILAASTRTGE